MWTTSTSTFAISVDRCREGFRILAACLLASAFALSGGGIAACKEGLEDMQASPPLDEPYFRCKVQPILTKSCSTFACHGDARRYYRVFARNRLRAGGSEADRNVPLTPLERQANFEASRAYVDPSGNAPQGNLLLTKPLETSAGGSFHRGATLFGAGNVFSNQEDPDFKTLSMWAQGAKEDASCVEPGSDQ